MTAITSFSILSQPWETHIHLPLFSLLRQLPLPLASYCHPQKKKEKKKKTSTPRENVVIATAFTTATPKSIHLSYMDQPGAVSHGIT